MLEMALLIICAKVYFLQFAFFANRFQKIMMPKQKATPFYLTKKFAKGSTILSFEKVVRIILGLSVHAWVVRYLGAEQFGYISYVYSVVIIFQSFSIFGLDELAMKSFTRDPNLNQHFYDILNIRLVMSLIAFILLTSLAFLYHHEHPLIAILITIYGFSLFPKSLTTFENILLTKEMYSSVFYARITSTLLVNILKVVGVLWKQDLIFFITIYTLEEVSQRLVNLWSSRKFINFEFKKISYKLNTKLIRQAFPVFLYSLLVCCDQKILFVALEYFKLIKDVAFYSLSNGLFEYTTFLPLTLCTILYPSLVRSYFSSPALYAKRKQYLGDLMTTMGLLVIIFFLFFGRLIISKVFGAEYLPSVSYLSLIIWMGPLYFFNFARFRWLLTENGMSDWLSLSVLSVTLNIIFIAILVPIHGLLGGIVAMYLSAVISNTIIAIFSIKIRSSLVVFLRSFLFCFRYREIISDLKKQI